MLHSQWDVLLRGIYSFHLKRWFKIFPKDDILIVDGDQIVTEPWLVLKKSQNFANLPIKTTKENFCFCQGKRFLLLENKTK